MCTEHNGEHELGYVPGDIAAQMVKMSPKSPGGFGAVVKEYWKQGERVGVEVVASIGGNWGYRILQEGAEATETTETHLPQAPLTLPPANWYPDPKGESRLRYWDGSSWTEHVHE